MVEGSILKMFIFGFMTCLFHSYFGNEVPDIYLNGVLLNSEERIWPLNVNIQQSLKFEASFKREGNVRLQIFYDSKDSHSNKMLNNQKINIDYSNKNLNEKLLQSHELNEFNRFSIPDIPDIPSFPNSIPIDPIIDVIRPIANGGWIEDVYIPPFPFFITEGNKIELPEIKIKIQWSPNVDLDGVTQWEHIYTTSVGKLSAVCFECIAKLTISTLLENVDQFRNWAIPISKAFILSHIISISINLAIIIILIPAIAIIVPTFLIFIFLVAFSFFITIKIAFSFKKSKNPEKNI